VGVVAKLPTYESLPILGYEVLKSMVKESEFLSGKDTQLVI
jgi:hypothetical protein